MKRIMKCEIDKKKLVIYLLTIYVSYAHVLLILFGVN